MRRWCDFMHDYNSQTWRVCVHRCKHARCGSGERVERDRKSVHPCHLARLVLAIFGSAVSEYQQPVIVPSKLSTFWCLGWEDHPEKWVLFTNVMVWSHSNCLWKEDWMSAVDTWIVLCAYGNWGPSHGNKKPEGERNSVTVVGWALIVSSAGRNTVQASLHVFTGNYLHFPHCHPAAVRICIPAHWSASRDVTDGTYDVCSLPVPFHLFPPRQERQTEERRHNTHRHRHINDVVRQTWGLWTHSRLCLRLHTRGLTHRGIRQALHHCQVANLEGEAGSSSCNKSQKALLCLSVSQFWCHWESTASDFTSFASPSWEKKEGKRCYILICITWLIWLSYGRCKIRRRRLLPETIRRFIICHHI